MYAIRVHEHGGTETLSGEEIPRPEPNDDDLLVRVEAAGVNPIDWMAREGYADDALDPALPYVPGWDLSGVVEQTGEEVSAFEPGDEVFGLVGMPDPGETYAEYAPVPATDVVEKPESIGHHAAAAVPMAALTARRALFEEADLRGGERVLVHAAAGGVGHFAVQLADHVDAEVVGTASARNASFLADLGVDDFVDYRSRRFEAVVDDVDVVLDCVGGETLARSVDVVAEGGRLVTLPEPPTDAVVERARTERNATVDWFSVEPDAAALAELRDLAVDGVIRPTVSGVWPLSEAGAVHEESASGHVRGKLVLSVGEP